MRPTWAEIDLAAVAHNVGVFKGIIGESDLCAVVKADAYGHGAVEVGRVAVEAGATWLGVALVDEAAELRSCGIDVPVLVLSEPRPSEMAGLADLAGVRPTVYSAAGIDAFASVAPAGSPVHLKLDTGMNRVGADPSVAVRLAEQIRGAGLTLEGLFTHFASADQPGDEFTGDQIAALDQALEDLSAAGLDPPVVHMANTGATLTRTDTHRSMVRVGIGLYGVEPSTALRDRCGELGLRQAVRLRSEVAHLHGVETGEGVSYGRRWMADRRTRLATLPIGYADGLTRAWWEHGAVLIGGRRRPIRGVVTMDQTVVEVDDGAAVGDEAVILGGQGDGFLAVGEMADATGTIGYEVLATIGSRVPRRY